MAHLDRPPKQGNTTTYQGKVAAGYTTILASEVDADLDLIYSAWNQGVDTTNIKDGSITGSKLAPGAVGTRELQDGGIQTVDIGAGQVTTPILADGSVTQAKISGGIVPGGAAGGDLTGTYPNPALGVVQGGAIQFMPRAAIAVAATYGDIDFNTPGTPSYDNTKPSWFIRTDYTGDTFTIFRAPPPGTAFVPMFAVDNAGHLLPGSVGRAALAVNAIYGSGVLATNPVSFNLNTPNVWTGVVTLPTITTRGGGVFLSANHSLSAAGTASGAICNQRWVRNGNPLVQRSFLVAAPAALTYMPFPGINWIDGPAAGNYIYVYEVMVAPGCSILATGLADGGFQATEIG